VIGKLIVSIELSVPSVSRASSTAISEEDGRVTLAPQPPSGGPSTGSGGTDGKAGEFSAQRQLSLVAATAVGALIPPSPSVVSATGAPLASSSTIKLDPADTGGASGQVIARSIDGNAGLAAGTAIGSAGTTTVLPGLLVQAPRTPPPRGEPPLADQPSTINEEVFLD
jgi:hypothetical protein